MTQVRVPTPLRKFTGGSEAVEAEGATVAALLADLETPLSGHQGAHLRRVGPGAPLRQHLRERRGHPLPPAPRHAGQGGRRAVDRARPSPEAAEPQRPHASRLAHAAFAAGPTAPGEGPLVSPSVLQLIGNTPLVELRRVRDGVPPTACASSRKLEGFNPGGSVKDRPALQDDRRTGIRQGRLRAGQDDPRLHLGQHRHRARHDRGRARLSRRARDAGQREPRAQAGGRRRSAPRRSSAIRSKGSDGAIRLCRKILAADPERYFKPDQYNNDANPLAHYETTGPEIWRQTDGAVTHFVAGIGTGGTIMGTGRYLKEQNPAIQVVAAEPDDAFHGLEGLKHMASSIVPGHLPRAGARPEARHRHRRRLRHGLPARARGRAARRPVVRRGATSRPCRWRARCARASSWSSSPTSATATSPPTSGSAGSRVA